MAANETYEEFVEKFKPKKTTDDCYTPPNIYEAVLNWAVSEYGIKKEDVVRPFYPGGDYEAFNYPEGCVVLDNPPFSIISKIVRYYNERGIRYFLFAPYITNFSIANGEAGCYIPANVNIVYENGARVATGFVTNLDEYKIRTAPDLYAAVNEENKKNEQAKKADLPKYAYPLNVITSSMMGYLSKYKIDLRFKKEDCYFLRALDSQREQKKAIFGGGYLLSEKAAAEKAAAEKAAAEKAAAEKAAAIRWQLSERERDIIAKLGKD